MTRAYYNEIDAYCAQWLKNLMGEGLIADGDVDTRSIIDVTPNDVKGYTQCHFFAGIGGWSGALRLAAWGDHRPVWTGSCPCQPFSLAGKQGGFADERHLWPYWHYLIAQCRPPTILGEQVASASQWLRLVRGDLEALDYAVGAESIEAAGAGADHLRDRYWFVGNHQGVRRGEGWTEYEFRGWRNTIASDGGVEHSEIVTQREPHHQAHAEPDGRQARPISGGAGDSGVGQADADDAGSQGRRLLSERADKRPAGPNGMADSDSTTIRIEPRRGSGPSGACAREHRDDSEIHLADANEPCASEGREQRSGQQRGPSGDPEALAWVIGADGKARRVKPGIRLLAHGVPARVAKLRALGNAIDLRPAAAFIRTVM